MNIKGKCPCGAELELDGITFINGGGRADEQGRVYLVEVRYDEWKEEHKDCKYLFGKKHKD